MTNEQKLRSALHAICNNYATSPDSVDKQLHAAVKLARETLIATAAQPAEQTPTDDEFKNFHRNLCTRFDYCHDDKDWKRDQVSLIEHIAKNAKVSQPAEQNVLSDAQIEDIADACLFTAPDGKWRVTFARAILAQKP